MTILAAGASSDHFRFERALDTERLQFANTDILSARLLEKKIEGYMGLANEFEPGEETTRQAYYQFALQKALMPDMIVVPHLLKQARNQGNDVSHKTLRSMSEDRYGTISDLLYQAVTEYQTQDEREVKLGPVVHWLSSLAILSRKPSSQSAALPMTAAMSRELPLSSYELRPDQRDFMYNNEFATKQGLRTRRIITATRTVNANGFIRGTPVISLDDIGNKSSEKRRMFGTARAILRDLGLKPATPQQLAFDGTTLDKAEFAAHKRANSKFIS